MKLILRMMPPATLPFDLPRPWPLVVYVLRATIILLASAVALLPLLVVAYRSELLWILELAMIAGGFFCARIAVRISISEMARMLKLIQTIRKSINFSRIAELPEPQRLEIEKSIKTLESVEDRIVELLRKMPWKLVMDYSQIRDIEVETTSLRQMPAFA